MAITFKFGADGSAYKRGLDKMRAETKAWAGGIKSMLVGAFAGAAVVGLKKWADGLDRIHKLSQRLSISTDSLQRLGHIAELNGASMEIMAKALTQIAKNAGLAITNGGEVEKAFARLNINIQEFINMKPEDQLVFLAEAYQEAEKSGTGMSDMLTILGGRAAELIPLLRQAPEELRKGMEDASTASERTIMKAVKLNDAIINLKNMVVGVVSDIIDMFEFMGQSLGIVAFAIVEHFQNAFGTIVDGAREMGRALEAATSGDGKGFAEHAKKFTQVFKDASKEAGNINDKMNKSVSIKLKNISATTQPGGRKEIEGEGPIHGPRNENAAEKAARMKREREQSAAEARIDAEMKRRQDKKDSDIRNMGDDFDDTQDFSIKESPERKTKSAPSFTTDIISSSLAAIGGGGGAAMFTNDPALAESKKQSEYLKQLLAAAQGDETTDGGDISGTKTRPET